MANLIDAGFLNNFADVFMFLLIFSVLYGLLTKVDFFRLGDKGKGLNAIIAITIALLTLMSAEVRLMVATMVPWFFVLMLFIVLILISAMIFGVSNDTIADLIKKPEANTWIIIFGVLILLFSLGSAFGQDLLQETDVNATNSDTSSNNELSGDLDTNTGDYQSNLVKTLFHPKVLGLLLLGIVGLLASIFITKVDN